MTVKQQLFGLCIAEGLSNREAAIRAGYSEKSAGSRGSQNATHPDVQELVSKLRIQRLRKQHAALGEKIERLEAHAG